MVQRHMSVESANPRPRVAEPFNAQIAVDGSRATSRFRNHACAGDERKKKAADNSGFPVRQARQIAV